MSSEYGLKNGTNAAPFEDPESAIDNIGPFFGDMLW